MNWPDSDVDDTPVEFRERCEECGRVRTVKGIAEDMWQYTRNEDGTYTPPQGCCDECMMRAPAALPEEGDR